MNRVALPEPWRGRAIVIRETHPADSWFMPAELATAASFRLPKRIDEWKRSRMAAKQLAIDLGLCASPEECRVERPWLYTPAGTRYVSISHSGGFAGAAIE